MTVDEIMEYVKSYGEACVIAERWQCCAGIVNSDENLRGMAQAREDVVTKREAIRAALEGQATGMSEGNRASLEAAVLRYGCKMGQPYVRCEVCGAQTALSTIVAGEPVRHSDHCELHRGAA